MARHTLALTAIALILSVLVFAGCAPRQAPAAPAAPQNAAPAQQNAAPMQPAGGQQAAAPAAQTKFSSTPEYAYAYLISGTAALDAKTQQALTGYTVSRQTLPDGSQNVTLTATNPAYTNQSAVVKQGEKLYFLERSMGDDDTTNNQDRFFRDDSIVLVDASGYVVQQGSP